ncbi:uncharacterized protein LOC108905878 [Anoplophora glabripennis]|uniref:uncharacterized protein LOC108905878 n=1 Tax=Anoplophora glabripennis TaxID=217634 RepID=UPI000874330F|nr:uncharacterized protein LOC108905878 [Anoplophora glabripennis]XP_018564455.1 uncharacterized protein LOC108905878 [Anoplophora glabripennis]XP_018564456.1 uncharacterized protein LOC108905878 [Anoplophora glabripennis]XP_018564457.1 uncharacterized protein LOC108905878 [Anoplophora glabripennis]
MALPDWSPKSPEWSKDEKKLVLEDIISEPTKQSLKDIISNSDEFPIKFPIDTGRCKTLTSYLTESTLERNINSVYPLIHENALELYCKFILYKRHHGSAVEKSLYKKMTLMEFINRLLKKRAVMFMGKDDKYLLLSGEKGSKGWENIGTDKEQPPLLLQNCISYDEIKLAVFLSVSSYTYFVNIGDRKNMAKYATDRKDIEDEGIIVGMIGPRLKKVNVMEFQEMVVNERQNTTKNGYGTKISSSVHKLFSNFYEEPCRDYSEVLNYKKTLPKNEERYVELKTKSIFDNHLYHKRLAISIDTLLMEANYRAAEKETSAYIYVVGLGLGVWKISDHQEKVYMDAFAKRISLLGKNLSSVSDICFSYINQETCGSYKNGEIFPVKDHPKSGIKIHIIKGKPHAKLLNADAGKLLVVSYAWDGNALPGNEYWSGKLGSSGDSAAASSTQITEIHNPHINPLVEANNLRVITKDGVVTFKKYQELIRCDHLKRKK